MTQPYTDADVELVAQTFIAEAKKNPVEPSHYYLWGGTSRLLTGPNEFDIARAVLSALAAAGRLSMSAGGQPDVWEYGRPDPDEPDGLMTFDGTPRVITPRMVRRPMRAVGPWLPVPATEEADR